MNKNESYQIAFLTEMDPICTFYRAGMKRDLTSTKPGLTNTIFH